MNIKTKDELSPMGEVALAVLNRTDTELLENICTNYFNVLSGDMPESLRKEINGLFSRIKRNAYLTEKEILAGSFILINMSSVVNEHVAGIQQLLHTECIGHE